MNARRRTLRNAITVGLAATVGLGWLAAWVTLSGDGPLADRAQRVKIALGSAESLGVGANVTIAGVEVGRVDAVERRGTGAVVELGLHEDQGSIPSDTRFGVRLRTLVGEKYVELYPGTSGEPLPDGGLLPPSQAEDYVDIDEILDTLRGPNRERARKMITGPGRGLSGRAAELGTMVAGLAATIDDAQPLLRTLVGARDQVARVTDELGALAAAVGARGRSIERFAAGLTTSAEAVADRDAAVRDALDRLPPTLRQVRETTATLRTTSRRATPVVDGLAHAVDDLGPALRRLRPAAQEGRELVRELSRHAPALGRTVDLVRALSPEAAVAFPKVRGALCELNPLVRYLRPYSRDIAAWFAVMGSTTNFYDANGHAARLFTTFGANSPKFLGEDASKIINAFVEEGIAGRGHALAYNPYPRPGAAAETPPPDAAIGPSSVREKYETVPPDC